MGRRRGTRPKEFFLSHAAVDRPFADRLVDVLRGHEIPVWYSVTNLVGSQEWHDEIGRALRRCDWFGVVVSPAALKSKWLRWEVQYALRAARFSDRIVPLLHQPCNAERISWVLPGLQQVDFRGDFDDGCRDLLRVWGIGDAT
jgi:hypothetical protein